MLAEVVRITHPRWVTRVLSAELTGLQNPAQMRLTRHIDPNARNALATEIFGKRTLVNDGDDLVTAEVVAGYRSRTTPNPGPASASC